MGPLVDEQIEDGRKLLAQLAAEGFDATLACWVRLRLCVEHEWFVMMVSEREWISKGDRISRAISSRPISFTGPYSDRVSSRHLTLAAP